MSLFILSVILLILGYVIYGAIVEKVFGADNSRKTPAIKYADGIDFVEMPVWKIFLIQFLNIAGLGPVFGAVLGAAYGPACFLWIVLGSIFAGGVHDYLTGMLSVRYKGKTMDYFIGKILSKHAKYFFVFFLVLILVLVGAVFAINPAKMLALIFKIPVIYFVVLIFGYYFLTTLLPVDKIIGRFYPFFALLLLIVTVSLLVSLFRLDTEWFPITFENLHPKNAPIFPLMFITIACGALSGFHATQSPIMARCLPNEKSGRLIFYGSMILEGLVALIWASLAIAFYHDQTALGNVLFDPAKGQGAVIAELSNGLIGKVGSVFAILSVVVLSITSGDTAFRSARLTLAESLHFDQKKLGKRFLLSAAVLLAGIAFTMFDITTLWYYFGWANQTFAMFSLWAVSVYLKKKRRCYWVSLVPAIFMTMVCTTYILQDKNSFALDLNISKIIAVIVVAIVSAIFFLKKYPKRNKTQERA